MGKNGMSWQSLFSIGILVGILLGVILAFACQEIAENSALLGKLTYEVIDYEENCAVQATRLVEKLREDGETAEIISVWTPHAMVKCTTCATTDGYKGYPVIYDSDGSINLEALTNYIYNDDVKQCGIKYGLR